MAPGLNGRQTGTVPKNKSRSCESDSHKLTYETFVQMPFSEWEQTSEVGGKSLPKKKGCTSNSEPDTDFFKYELGRSRSSTMISQNGNEEGCSQDSASGKINVPDRRQVVNKLGQIQSYVQQTAALMNTLKSSDSQNSKIQYEKLSLMLEDLKDSESKLKVLLSKMDHSECRIDSLLNNISEFQESQCTKNSEGEEEELARKSLESKKKLEVLQKRKQDLLILQEKAKKQLQEAQAEQSRLVARASSLNQELSTNKMMDLNVQQLSNRLKTVREMYNTRNQINESLNEKPKTHKIKSKHVEENQSERSEAETDYRLIADKMEELNAMKTQLSQIQKIMASITSVQNSETPFKISQTNENYKDHENRNSQSSSFTEEENGGEGDNILNLEQAKSKLNQLTQLLDIVQSAQNSNSISPSYMQLISNFVNDETTNFSPECPSTASSVKSPQNREDITVLTMQSMTKELEETTAAMREERDRLLATRQELQDIAKRLPLNKSEAESVSPDYDSESEPVCAKDTVSDTNTRDNANGFVEVDETSNSNGSSLYLIGSVQNRHKSRGRWNSSSPGSNCATQERRNKNESLSRESNHSTRISARDPSHWSSPPSVNYCHDRTESQQQLEMSGNLCEMMLCDPIHKGVVQNNISLQEMFSQHQLLTCTVAKCSQLLWLQQKQIVELRNAIMLQNTAFPNQQSPSVNLAPSQSQINAPTTTNPLLIGPSFSNVCSVLPSFIQQHQNFVHPFGQNIKLNAGDIQSFRVPHQDFPEQYLLQHGNSNYQFSDGFGCDLRLANFNRFNMSGSSNTNQNLSSGLSNRGPNGINSMVPEDSGALNNQVPPGNRANNYWDNFRSYSRQNLLSNPKSNEDIELSRRYFGAATQERFSRDFVLSSLQNNQPGTSLQSGFNSGNVESTSNDPLLQPPSQNVRTGHHSQVVRSSSSESQRNPGKNESRNQENDSRNLNSSTKNESERRTRHPDSTLDIRSVRNDVSQNLRSTDNLISTRNFIQLVRDSENEEVAQGNNKKRLERTQCRNEGSGNLNNRGYHNRSLWDNISAEVSTFIRANESRPHFLFQLFRDLQHVTTDSLRQRILMAIQETVTANNLTDRTSNASAGNVNILENRNNIRENRSNLNRNLVEDPDRMDDLFYHLRENQNTIRQNMGLSSYFLGGNLENPNISNIRDLRGSRNNLENEGLRDLRTYFEANLCNFGHNSTLENPNLSNIRENLTRRAPGMSDSENIHPKNVFLSIYDNAIEPRRRNHESPNRPDFGFFRNSDLREDYIENDSIRNCENVRDENNHFNTGNNFEGAVGGRPHHQENRMPSSRMSGLLNEDNFGRSRQFFGSGNDSGIDVNFNNDDRKRNFTEIDSNANQSTVKFAKNGAGEGEGAAALILRSDWEEKCERNSFDSSFNESRKNATPFFSVRDNTFLNCRTFQRTDNGDLAEADQSRNEISGAESDSGFIKAQNVDSEGAVGRERNQEFEENNFSAQNIPEAERNFVENKNSDEEAACATEPEGNSDFPNFGFKSEKSSGEDDSTERKKESSGGFYNQIPGSSSENASVPKLNEKHKKKADTENGRDVKKISYKSSTNKFRDSSFSQEKYNGTDEFENRKTEIDSGASASRQQCENRELLCYGAFQLALDKSIEAEKTNKSPESESESEWECNGLDQVPTRLDKQSSPRKSEDL